MNTKILSVAAYFYLQRNASNVSWSPTPLVKKNSDFKVVQKINLKLGGTNHVLDDKAYGPVVTDKTMMVGIDVTHPAPGDEGAPSVAAVVASRDKYLSQWPVDLRINKRRQEMVEMLRDMLKTRLEHYKDKNNNSLPTNILIYRDGVGEGQYKIVLEEELPKLRNACKEVYGRSYKQGVTPRISLIVVGKRHHTRFYRTDSSGKVLYEKRSNPQCGTVSTMHIHWHRNGEETENAADSHEACRRAHHPRVQLGLLSPVPYGDCRDSTPSPLFCPAGRDLHNELPNPCSGPRASDVQPVLPLRQGHDQYRYPSARLLCRQGLRKRHEISEQVLRSDGRGGRPAEQWRCAGSSVSQRHNVLHLSRVPFETLQKEAGAHVITIDATSWGVKGSAQGSGAMLALQVDWQRRPGDDGVRMCRERDG